MDRERAERAHERAADPRPEEWRHRQEVDRTVETGREYDRVGHPSGIVRDDQDRTRAREAGAFAHHDPAEERAHGQRGQPPEGRVEQITPPCFLASARGSSLSSRSPATSALSLSTSPASPDIFVSNHSGTLRVASLSTGGLA
jgi:hypothetical protein